MAHEQRIENSLSAKKDMHRRGKRKVREEANEHSTRHGSRSTGITPSRNFTSDQNIFTAYFTLIKEARRSE
jgi:hypothetical protein